MNKKTYIWIAMTLILFGLLALGYDKRKMLEIGWMKYTANVNPVVRHFETPKPHAWKPLGERQIHPTNALMPRRNIWRARHGDALNSDEVTTVVGPVLALDWKSETNYFNPSSASFDSSGDLYSTPQFPADRVLIEKLDGDTGKLLWKIIGTKNPTGGGRPLVLTDPKNPDKEIIYVGVKAEVLAVHPDGQIIYQKATGFEEPPAIATFKNLGEYNSTGPNYNPIFDGLVWATGTGMIYGVDRETGERNIEPFLLPGKPSPGKDNRTLPAALQKLEQDELSYQFEGTPKGYTLAHQLAVVLGENVVNSNFFSVDQRTGSMWMTATDLDEADGNKDGISEVGAVYRLDLVPDKIGKFDWKIVIGAKLTFEGGSASTPAMRGDGMRGYVGDAFGNMVAFDRDCNIVWKFALGKKGSTSDQIGGSIAVSADNSELYAITRKDVVKIIDRGDHATLSWRANLDMYTDVDPSFKQWNLNTATIAANGIAFLAGVGPTIKFFGETPVFLPVKVGVGLLDRETGDVRWFAGGKDIGQSSMGMVMPTPDGGIVISHSPLRRALARGLFGDRIYPTSGGMTKYSPQRIDILIRDIAVAGANRIERSREIYSHQPEGTRVDLMEVEDLITQARSMSTKAISNGDITSQDWQRISEQFDEIERQHKKVSVEASADLLKGTASLMREIANSFD